MEHCGMSWDLFGMETERETEEVGADTREEKEGKEEARNIMCPMPAPHTDAIDDNLPSELQLNRLAYKSHRGCCNPKRGVMSRLRSP